jgi:pyruvate kinase
MQKLSFLWIAHSSLFLKKVPFIIRVKNVAGGEFVKAKIVCTIGPASMRPEALAAMREAGMDVARLNLSHGDFEVHRRVAEDIRDIGSVSILVDLPGPKIRIGRVDGSVRLVPGNRVHFTTQDVLGNSDELSVSHPGLPRELSVGGSFYINDGLIEMRVASIDEGLEGFTGRVVSGGEVTSFKGVNAPGARLSVKPPTDADHKGIEFGVEFCDWFAASFVRERGDVEGVKNAIDEVGGSQPVISKIEHGEAVENIDEIIEASDGVMVARGDLGIEVPSWEVPLIQKRIIERCNNAGKPVIVATQMLESMVVNPRPSRAEASDVANAILDGADAVMLSGETAMGLFPVEAVKVMNSITQTVEEKAPRVHADHPVEGSIPDVIGQLASSAARAVKPAAIIVVTRSGFSARMVSKHRPRTPIISVARSPGVNRRVRLYWGVEPLDVEWTDDRDALLVRAVRGSVEAGYLARGDSVMIVSGSTLEAPGRTSSLEILSVEDILEHAGI